MTAIEPEILNPWWESDRLYTANELRRDLLIFAGADLGPTQFYQWLKFALIKAPKVRKLVYTARDRYHLLKFATEYKPRYPTLQAASIAFYQDVLAKEEEKGKGK